MGFVAAACFFTLGSLPGWHWSVLLSTTFVGRVPCYRVLPPIVTGGIFAALLVRGVAVRLRYGHESKQPISVPRARRPKPSEYILRPGGCVR